MTPAPDHADDSAPGMPRWVKTFIGIIVVVLVMLVFLKIIGGGGHGPGRPRASADTGQTQQKHR
ncbi:MAG TPA: hypothetical protein VFS56_01485 [Gemmatimonadaceae bacterium]|nr:hypothetical protein [Gemmatimonadaceae bacterium]